MATDGAIAAFGRDGRRLRPNVVVGGVPGLAEREWEHTLLAAGDAVIGLADLRGRCIITTWDPDSHTQDADVLRDIRSRLDGTLALNAWTARPGMVRVGDRGADDARAGRRPDPRLRPLRVIRRVRAEDLAALGAVVDATACSRASSSGTCWPPTWPVTRRTRSADRGRGRSRRRRLLRPRADDRRRLEPVSHRCAPRPAGGRRGAALMGHVERELTAAGQRLLLVETSGLEEFERTRTFYRGLAYGEEARIRDFYAAGDDKIVFRKLLTR